MKGFLGKACKRDKLNERFCFQSSSDSHHELLPTKAPVPEFSESAVFEHSSHKSPARAYQLKYVDKKFNQTKSIVDDARLSACLTQQNQILSRPLS